MKAIQPKSFGELSGVQLAQQIAMMSKQIQILSIQADMLNVVAPEEFEAFNEEMGRINQRPNKVEAKKELPALPEASVRRLLGEPNKEPKRNPGRPRGGWMYDVGIQIVNFLKANSRHEYSRRDLVSGLNLTDLTQSQYTMFSQVLRDLRDKEGLIKSVGTTCNTKWSIA